MNYQILQSCLSAEDELLLQSLFDRCGSEAAYWSLEDIRQALLVPSTLLLLAMTVNPDHSKQLVGYLIARQLDNCAELFYVWVAAQVRKQGLARALCGKMEEILQATGTAEIFLEVRPSNQAARMLYEKIGYRLIGQRQKYYSDGENAFVLAKRLGD